MKVSFVTSVSYATRIRQLQWKYRWRGADFERKLFVTSVYQHLLLHY